jgi:hypothetical protein
MSAPRLTEASRREVARRYREGESMPKLAKAFGVAVCAIDNALWKLGVRTRTGSEAQALVRSEVACRVCGVGCHPNAVRPLCPVCKKGFCERCDRALPAGAGAKTRLCRECKAQTRRGGQGPRRCRVCRTPLSRGAVRDLCMAHRGAFCSVCDQPLPAGRVLRRCRSCEAAKKARLWARHGRRCTRCRVREATLHHCRCRECLREAYLALRRALCDCERPCRDCGVMLPRGRRLERCVECQRAYRREQKIKRRAEGRHHCAMCRTPLAVKRDTYCSGCAVMLAKWRKAWHAGNPVARQLGRVRSTRRWQEAAARIDQAV